MIRGDTAGPVRASIAKQTVFVVDDDPDIRDALSGLLRFIDLACSAFASVAEFLAAPLPPGAGRLGVDVRLPGESGLEFQSQLISSLTDPDL